MSQQNQIFMFFSHKSVSLEELMTLLSGSLSPINSDDNKKMIEK